MFKQNVDSYMTNKIKGILVYLLVLGIFGLNTAKAQNEPPTRGDYYNKNKINFLTGGNNYENDKGINLSTIHGIHLSETFASGIGIGITGGNKYSSTIVPVFVNGTLSLTDTRKLYLSGDVGYSFATEKAIKGGILGELSVGWKFNIGKFAFAPEVGYRYDGYKSKALELLELNDEYVWRITDNYFSHHINSFSAGISFFF